METEKRLIDANATMKANMYGNTAPITHRKYAETLIQESPTVDAVEVVRCKDCMWSRPKDHREPTDTPRELICQRFKHHHIPAPWGARMAVKADDFCSYGERKTDG